MDTTPDGIALKQPQHVQVQQTLLAKFIHDNNLQLANSADHTYYKTSKKETYSALLDLAILGIPNINGFP
eukprot:Pgem_evm1s15456